MFWMLNSDSKKKILPWCIGMDVPISQHIHEGADMQGLGHQVGTRAEAEHHSLPPWRVRHLGNAHLETVLLVVTVVDAERILLVADARRNRQQKHSSGGGGDPAGPVGWEVSGLRGPVEVDEGVADRIMEGVVDRLPPHVMHVTLVEEYG